MEGTTNHPRAPLQLLPNELLSLIFHDGQLTKYDMKNMRLVGREFHRAANEILFRSIRISRLCKDRDIFVRSCDDPSIADYVKEVIWDELGWDQTIFPELSRPMAARNIPLWPHRLTTAQRALLDIESKEMFWFPVADPTSLYLRRTRDTDVADRRKLAVDRFGPTFQACVDKLTKLHTFTSRPINPDRLRGSLTPIPSDLTIRPRRGPSYLQFPWGAWNKHAVGELFDALKHSYTTTYRDGRAILPRNDGLFLFLLPAMDRPTSKVRHLNWGDEYPGFSHVRPFPPESLKQLESLEACFLADNSSCCSVLTAGSNHDSLIKALAHATKLQDVKLCCHHDHDWLFPQGRFNVCPIERNLAVALSELNLPLRTLHLSGIQARKPNIKNWISVIKHTETLQEVFIDVEERSIPQPGRPREALWEDLNALPGWGIPEVRVCGFPVDRNCILDRCSITPKPDWYEPYKITMTKQHA